MARERHEDRRLRRASLMRVTGAAPQDASGRAGWLRVEAAPEEPSPEHSALEGTASEVGSERDAVTDRLGLTDDEEDDAPRQRAEQQTLWVETQVRAAMERGDFDDLPGAGKPLNLPDRHDPDWWVKKLIERERVTGVLPPALALRREDAELDAVLDRLPHHTEVRRAVDDFNRRVVEARRQLQGGPPVVTPVRDPDGEAAAWTARRDQRRRLAEERARALAAEHQHGRAGRRAFWRSRRAGGRRRRPGT